MLIGSDKDAFYQKMTQPRPRLELDNAVTAIDGDLVNRAHAIAREALSLSEDGAYAFIRTRATSEGKSITEVARSIIYAWKIYR